jgi:hypothetical protein
MFGKWRVLGSITQVIAELFRGSIVDSLKSVEKKIFLFLKAFVAFHL